MNLTDLTRHLQLRDASGKPLFMPAVRAGDTVHVYKQGGNKLVSCVLVSLNPLVLREPAPAAPQGAAPAPEAPAPAPAAPEAPAPAPAKPAPTKPVVSG